MASCSCRRPPALLHHEHRREPRDERDGGASAEVDQGAFDHAFALFPRLAERRTQLAGTLSGGEQQMLAIARVLMAKPKILMFDEPSFGLSPLFVLNLFEIIRTRGLIITLSSWELSSTGVASLPVEPRS